jgi:hypothetical protein
MKPVSRAVEVTVFGYVVACDAGGSSDDRLNGDAGTGTADFGCRCQFMPTNLPASDGAAIFGIAEISIESAAAHSDYRQPA